MPPLESPRRGRIGLALAGGGPEGAIYEIGALRALDDALDGVDFNDIPVTVGVSSGALVGACLANGITTAQLVRSVVHKEPGEDPFVPEMFLKPAAREYAGRLIGLPALVASALMDAVRGAEPDTGFVAGVVARLAGVAIAAGGMTFL